jgi:4-amino-4-deoxy-L-arabinose transferase-like glycosyltransferase
VVILWFALARLYSKRAAWWAAVILATSPMYAMISRQAITDMPTCSLGIGCMALFALALYDDRPLTKWRFGLNANHFFLLGFAILTVPQLIYFAGNIEGTRLLIGAKSWIPGPWVMAPFAGAFIVVSVWAALTTKTTRQVYMYWFFLLNGMAVLSKGPVAPALCGLAILAYLAVTGEWKLLLKLELPRGIIIALIVCLPWHFAIFLRDGMAWLSEYVQQHLLGRAFRGIEGDKGSFDYYIELIGVGMWPWGCLIPPAVAQLARDSRLRTREGKLRLLMAAWAILAYAFFSFVQTKYHHYILPAVPGLAVLIAFWLDDLWEGRVPGTWVAVTAALGLFLMTSIDVVGKQERLTALYTYRYDRPWPYEAPWNIDFTIWLFLFAVGFCALLGTLYSARLRRHAILGMMGLGLLFCWFNLDVLMSAASPHWGQRALHERYYQHREIHGVDLYYYGPHEIAEDWGDGKDFAVKSYIPDTLKVGDAMTVKWQLRNSQEGVQEQGTMAGTVAAIHPDDHEFTIAVSPEERAKIAPQVEKGRASNDDKRRWLYVNADRMIAWQLNWRGEDFWSGGEIWNPRDVDMQTVFEVVTTDHAQFLKYLKDREGTGRKFWVVTEIGRLGNLKSILPTQTARDTFEEPDKTSNKFGLASFTLDKGTPESEPAPQPAAPPPQKGK